MTSFLVLLLSLVSSPLQAADAPVQRHAITVFKSPSCGCCSKWEDHLRANGFEVTSIKTTDMKAKKAELKIPTELQSCHTGVVEGYVIEGHVPADVIQKFLKEMPKKSLGLAVPGMPVGSPGMEGPNPEKYKVVSFDRGGVASVYADR